MFWSRITARRYGGGGAADDRRFVGRPLGRILVKMNKLTREQVVEALNQQKSLGGLLGEILVRLGYVTPVDVDAALIAQRGDAPPAG